jgi:hypothetical protein
MKSLGGAPDIIALENEEANIPLKKIGWIITRTYGPSQLTVRELD